MAKIFITGSADGLGLLTAKQLISEGHEVVLHARNASRAADAKRKLPAAEAVLTGDLSNIQETKELADDVNRHGKFEVIIHNAGVYQVAAQQIFKVNTLAPYILTCLIARPKRLIYLSSGMHLHGQPNFSHFSLDTDGVSYSDSKLHVVMLSMAVARKWPGVYSNAVDPGWVPTKMGGRGAPDDLDKGYETQVWLTTGNDPEACVTGKYFHHKKQRRFNIAAGDVQNQEEFLERCKELTGIALPV